MFERPGLPSDHINGPYPNEQAAAAANGGKAPPDLSLMAKARAGGPNYIYSILTGYEDPPAGVEVPEGGYYNAYFPGHVIAMPPPLSDDQVTYADGTSATVPQMAQDVAEFLMWAAEPKLEERKGTGLKVDPVPGRAHRPHLRAQAEDLGRRAALRLCRRPRSGALKQTAT